jgi:hypothetical protein
MSIRANLVSALRTFLTLNGRPEADSLVTALDDYIAYKIEQQPLQLLTINGGKVEGPLAPAILKIVNDAIADYDEQIQEALYERAYADAMTTGKGFAHLKFCGDLKAIYGSAAADTLTQQAQANGEYDVDSDEAGPDTQGDFVPSVYAAPVPSSGSLTSRPLTPGEIENSKKVIDSLLMAGVKIQPESLSESEVRRVEAATTIAEAQEKASDELVEFERLVTAQRAAAREELIRAEEAAKVEHQSPRCQHDLTQPIATRHVIAHTDSRLTTKCFACGEVRNYKTE